MYDEYMYDEFYVKTVKIKLSRVLIQTKATYKLSVSDVPKLYPATL